MTGPATVAADRIAPPTPETIARAVALLRAGKLVAFPTETVYGLGADAGNAAAVRAIFAAKGRPADHPVIVHLPDATLLSHWARAVPAGAQRLADAFWPGPLTMILPRSPRAMDVVTGGQDSVGLRVPSHPVAQALLRAFAAAGGTGVAAPSANRFGRISPTKMMPWRRVSAPAPWMVRTGPGAPSLSSRVCSAPALPISSSGRSPRWKRPR